MAVQITLDTRDVFIECTATDLAKANVVLNTVTTMFSEYCSAPFEVEPVEVIDALGTAQRARHIPGLPLLGGCQGPESLRQHC
jgi:phenylalanyl-tRNA synthetase beta subunit